MDAHAARLSCSKCNKTLSRPDRLKRHEERCSGPRVTSFECAKCGRQFKRKYSLKRHALKCSGPKTLKAPKRKAAADGSPKGTKESLLERRDQTNFASDPPHIPEFLRQHAARRFRLELYTANYRAIRHYVRPNRVQTLYNIRLVPTMESLTTRLEQIFNDQSTAFKINGSLGFVLRHRVKNDLRYFHSSVNNHRLLDMPILVNNRDDFQDFIDAIDWDKILEIVIQQRPDSTWVVDEVTNLTIYINHLELLIK